MKAIAVLVFIAGFLSLLGCSVLGLGMHDTPVLLTAIPCGLGMFMIMKAYEMSLGRVLFLTIVVLLGTLMAGALIRPLL